MIMHAHCTDAWTAQTRNAANTVQTMWRHKYKKYCKCSENDFLLTAGFHVTLQISKKNCH